MLTIAYYFLQVVLCSGMMMGYYWLVLRNKRFHQYNRFYLLAAALLSWIVPLIKISWSQPVVTSEQPQVMQFLSVVADNNSQIERTIHTQPVSEWSRGLLVTGLYFGVAAILFFGMVQAFAKLYRLLRDHSCKNVGDVYLVLTQAKGTPFSFFRYIFWNEEIDIRSEAGKQILQHELTHVQQKHSFDKLFIQLMLIGGWFNPFFWLLRKEMDMIHEFIADKKAVNNGDTAALAQMLLTAAYPQQQFALTHPFFFSPIKRRLQMLTNNKNPRYSYIRRLVVLPLLAIVIVLFAFRSKERRENAEISVATVMENAATDQKQFFNSFLQGIGNFFDNKNNDQTEGFHSVFYNGRPLTVSTSFRLKDLSRMMVMPHLDKDHLNLVPSLNITATAPDPLFVIDGKKQADKKALDALDPNDIQMIQIWKGADAFAKYGEAGKDGVIEITTKSFVPNKKTSDGFPGLIYEGVAKDVTVYPNTTAIVTIDFSDAKKGDQVYVSPNESKLNNWSVYSAWVEEDGVIKIRFANFTGKQVTVGGNEYTVRVGKFEGPEPHPNWIQKYYDTTNWFTNKWQYTVGLQPLILINDIVFTGEWKSIDQNIISSVTVLKDETAVKKYGEQARNGVIEITTKSNVVIKPGPANTSLITDSLGDIKWQTLSGTQVQEKKFPDTLIWVKGQQVPAKNRVVNDGVIKAESVPITVAGKRIDGHLLVEGFKIDNSPATIELKKQNPDVKFVAWRDKTHLSIQLKDGTEETYDLTKPDSKNRAETKYGKLPEVPAVIANAPVRDEVTVVGYGVRNPGKTLTGNLIATGTIRGGTFSGTLTQGPNTFYTGIIPAEFPGGLPEWAKFLERNLDKDVPRKKGAPPGKYTVVLLFDVSENGTISNVQAQNDPGYGTKAEAINLILKSPKWTPALKEGKRVNYTHKQFITFFVKDPKAAVDPVLSNGVGVFNSKNYGQKLEELKANNTKSYFVIDSTSCIAFSNGYLSFDNVTDMIFMNGKRITPAELNSKYNRNDLQNGASDPRVNKKFGKDVFLLSTKPYKHEKLVAMVMKEIK